MCHLGIFSLLRGRLVSFVELCLKNTTKANGNTHSYLKTASCCPPSIAQWICVELDSKENGNEKSEEESMTGHGTLLDTYANHGTVRSFTIVGTLSGRGRTFRVIIETHGRSAHQSGRWGGPWSSSSSSSRTIHTVESATTAVDRNTAVVTGCKGVDGIAEVRRRRRCSRYVDVGRLVERQVDTTTLSAIQRRWRRYIRRVAGHTSSQVGGISEGSSSDWIVAHSCRTRESQTRWTAYKSRWWAEPCRITYTSARIKMRSIPKINLTINYFTE